MQSGLSDLRQGVGHIDVALNGSVPEAFHRGSGLAGLLGNIDGQHWSPGNRALPIRSILAGLGIAPPHFRPPRAVMAHLRHRFTPEWAFKVIWAVRGFLGHELVFSGYDHVDILHVEVNCGSGEGMGMGLPTARGR